MEKKDTNQKRTFVGEVVSDKMNKTIVVKVVRTFKEPRMHKILRKMKKYKVHDEQEVAKIGDIVSFHEGRPVSKDKYMYLAQVVKARVL